MIQGRMLRFSALLAVVFGSTAALAAPAIEAVPGEFLVRVRDAQVFQAPGAFKAFAAENVQTVLKDQNLFLVKRNVLERPEFSIARLQNSPSVVSVSPNFIYRINRIPNDPKLGDLWGMKNSAQKGGRAGIDIGAEQAWDIQTGSRDVVVAVIDTGLDYTHPDLVDNAWTNDAEKNGTAGVDDDKNGYVDDIHGYDFVNNDGDPMDDHGHGTHCSGTIGAKGDDGKGIVGVAWNVRIAGVKFLDAGGSGTLANAVRAIDYANKMGAKIQSNSWGGGGYTAELEKVIQAGRDRGVLFVAAAGNNYNDNDASPTYPATYGVDNIVAVAALDNSGQLASFSNWGRTKVHVAAPGVDVMSSVPFALNPVGYDTWSGTSMATPHVAGIAALIISQFPDISYKDIKARLIATARPLGALRGKIISSGIAHARYSLTGEQAPVDMEDPYNWLAKAHSLSSPHPYPDKAKLEFEVKVDGATQVALFFDKFETERGYDTVTFKDKTGKVVGTWNGSHNGEFSPPAQGDTIIVTFAADDSVNGYGFDVSKVAYRMGGAFDVSALGQ